LNEGGAPDGLNAFGLELALNVGLNAFGLELALKVGAFGLVALKLGPLGIGGLGIGLTVVCCGGAGETFLGIGTALLRSSDGRLNTDS